MKSKYDIFCPILAIVVTGISSPTAEEETSGSIMDDMGWVRRIIRRWAWSQTHPTLHSCTDLAEFRADTK